MLGSGGFSKVLSVNHRETNKNFAVKVFRKSRMIDIERETQDAKKEAAILFELNHKNIVKYVDFYQD